MTNRHIVDRALPERSKLRFYFPVPKQGDDYYVVTMPFFENLSIKESKKARYQKYSLISRSSNLYSYLGADSRMINLSFNITLPHIMDEHPDTTYDKYVIPPDDSDNVEGEKRKFKAPHNPDQGVKGRAFVLGTEYTQKLAVDSARQVLTTDWALSGMSDIEKYNLRVHYGIDSIEKTVATTIPLSFLNSFGLLNTTLKKTHSELSNTIVNYQADLAKRRIIDIIIYWTNIIRSSVTNYSENPIYGPPIIRLNHGILYQDVPCICTNYSIDYNEQAGYDLDTLLPRQLRISMKLEEIRTGDFGKFSPEDSNNPIKRDNLAGWESVVLGSTNSMDPGSGGV